MSTRRADRATGSDGASKTATTVDSSGQTLAAANAKRICLTIQNLGTADVYVGDSLTNITTRGVRLHTGEIAEERDYLGAMCGKTTSGTADVRVWEIA